MLRPALACCALLACTGSPPEDKRAPAQAPIAPTEPADAAPPDAPSSPCFALPVDADGERAGLRFLAHRVPPATTTRAPKLRDVIKLPLGKPSVIPGLMDRGSKQTRPIHVPEVLHAEGLLAGPRSPAAVTVIAPRHLDGAVLEIYGAHLVTLAIGDAGMATLARYREHYVKPRLAASSVEAGHELRLAPLAVMLDDLDGDGTLEQISFTRVAMHHANPSVKSRDPELEVGVLWSTGELAFARVWYDGLRVPAYYVVPPPLSGGKVLLVSTRDDRIVLDGKTLTKLPPSDDAGDKRCLQTSTTEPATVVAVP